MTSNCPSLVNKALGAAAAALLISACSTTAELPEVEPPDFAGTSWLAEDINGRGVMDMLQSTLEFDADDRARVGGNGGCNRYFGSVALDGWNVSFGAMGSTRMACAEAVMDQEQRLFQALAAATRYELDSVTDLLTFYDESDEAILRFSRMQK